jgi:hypothetical protein
MYQYNQMIKVPDTSGSYLLIGGPFAQILSSLIAEVLTKIDQEGRRAETRNQGDRRHC